MASKERTHVWMRVVAARNLQSCQAMDAYCVVRFGPQLRRRMRGATCAGTVHPVWNTDVEIGNNWLTKAEADGEADVVRVDVLNEKSFFFDMFARQGQGHGHEQEHESEQASDASDTSSCGDGDASSETEPSSTASQHQCVGVGESDETVGTLELSVRSLIKRAQGGERTTDAWYCLDGATDGEVRLWTLVWWGDDPVGTEGDDVDTDLDLEMDAGNLEACFHRIHARTASHGNQLTDYYGFSLPHAATKEWHHMQSYEACREARRIARWEEAFERESFTVPRSRWPTKQLARVQEMARRGVPRSWRSQVYMAMSGGHVKRAAEGEGYYESLLERAEASDLPVFREIELDIDRTFGHSGTKICTEEGRAVLRRVLKAYSLRNAAVGYCQGLNFVVAFLTLQLDEESTFWVLAAICEDLFPGYYTPAMTETQIDMLVLKQMITEDLPELHAFANNVGLPLELLASQWLLCLFTTAFPAETVFRIFDCIMTEGPHIVFAVMMAHLRRIEPSIIDLEDFQTALSFIKRTENALVDADAFLYLTMDEAKNMTFRRVEASREVQSICVQEEVLRAQRARMFHHQLATVYQIPALAAPAARLLRFFQQQTERTTSTEIAVLLTLLCHGLVWLAEQSKRWNK